MTRLEKLVLHYGSQVEIAKALDVTEGAVSQWVSTGGLPAKRAIMIEKLTGGKFKAVDIVAPSEKEDV